MAQLETVSNLDVTTPFAFRDYPCPEGTTFQEFRGHKEEVLRLAQVLQSGTKHLNGTMTLSGGWSFRGADNGELYLTRPDGEEFKTWQMASPSYVFPTPAVPIPPGSQMMFDDGRIFDSLGGCPLESHKDYVTLEGVALFAEEKL